ncbi:neurotransmitter-gated ion-channel ligand binding domain-containing protein [Ditylenchus destructor]|uniref:Neurotransmitter-gated ion-channel ligand binding domain-containing protein n=1 Tax=Ditylenchus destructor TaxID=166010 RepID=A0AAD4NJA6_9BILA|nr:neurotransmitter-gated ion-channel ligand binding domain-containing protein [Ditylenchus destructor]
MRRFVHLITISALILQICAASNQLKLIQDMLESYDRKAKPTWDNNRPVNVTFSMDLYQILELNEPQQYILLNAWIIERWHDEFLYWNPLDYGNITELRLPYDCIWLPDTTLYNSLVMKDDDTRRLLNAKLTTNVTRKAVLIELLYPTIYKFSCLLNLRFFPYDLQVCTMTFSSWTYDQKGIDYLPYSDTIGTSNFLENEGWYLLRTAVRRKEVKYSCCPNKYTLLKLTLYLRRKPLFYLINLIIPTSIITLIAIVGFFTTSSASGMREEKVSLGITTLLSMSILMLMVSDQMPTTSTFIPLIGWFILGMIVVISMGTLASSVVIAVQKRGRLGERLSQRAIRISSFFAYLSLTDVPMHLRKGTKEHSEAPPAPSPALNYRKSIKAAKRPEKVDNDNESKNDLHKGSKYRRVGLLSNIFRKGQNGSMAGTPTMLKKKKSGISPDKSTDPLFQPSSLNNGRASFASDDGSTVGGTVLITSGSAAAEESVISSPKPYYRSVMSPHSRQQGDKSGMVGGVDMRLTFDADDGTSNGDSELGVQSPKTVLTPALPQPPRPPSNNTERPPNSATRREQMAQHIKAFNENIRQNRQLAQKEYEWLATVLERCCFIVFVIIFALLTAGINLIGYTHWSNIDDYPYYHEAIGDSD